MPPWLETLSIVSLILAGVCAIVIAMHIAGHPQHMWIMNLVWPITALYFGPIALLAYFRWAPTSSKATMMQHKAMGHEHHGSDRPFWQKCAIATSHCGSGCTMGDIVAEALLYYFPLAVFGREIFGAWIVDFIFAFLFGVAFQYFTIKPMRNLTVKEGLVTALKADTFSLTAWQIGMYGWMAIVTFILFQSGLPKSSPVFWFMMQIAMIFGFTTSYPVNWVLINRGLKEKM